MQVFLHFLNGTSSVVEVNSDTTLEGLLESFDCSNCRVVYQGAHLTSLDGLTSNANIYLTGDLDGGKKKKKKKVYTTKKKNKHIHKRVKMGIYSLYSVDGISLITQAKATSLNNVKPAPHVDPESSWRNTGTVITADSAIPLLRWTPKQSRRTNK
jgi:small subunit ribosomal protein S27Ae